MGYLIFIILLPFVTLYAEVKNNEYCKINCVHHGRKYPHIMCLRNKQCGPSANCSGYEKAPMTDPLRQALLDKHNEIRNRVALGKEKRGTIGAQPPANDMNVMKYDRELEDIAQCWANECKVEHDGCRNTLDLKVGQNVAFFAKTVRFDIDKLDKLTVDQVDIWANEVIHMLPEFIDKFPLSRGRVIGHYTQIVWASNEYLGCGRSLFSSGRWHNLILVCNYGSAETTGNTVNKRVYGSGKTCTRCYKDMKCGLSAFKGLCGMTITVGDSTYNPDDDVLEKKKRIIEEVPNGVGQNNGFVLSLIMGFLCSFQANQRIII